MTDHPILFSAPMIRALLDGRKTMTRRLAWRENGKPTKWQKVQPGDKLWVKESIRIPPPITTKMLRDGADTWPTVMYDTDLDTIDRNWCKEHDWKSRPSIHMPKWASRLTLIVTAGRIERLMDIRESDALAEGINEIKYYGGALGYHYEHTKNHFGYWCSPTVAFEELWTSIHGPKSWNANPEVVVISADVVKENIDKIAARR